jgi:hypothetical protein
MVPKTIDTTAARAAARRVRIEMAPVLKKVRAETNRVRFQVLGQRPRYELSIASAFAQDGRPLFQVTISQPEKNKYFIETLHGDDLGTLRADAEKWVADVGATYSWRG